MSSDGPSAGAGTSALAEVAAAFQDGMQKAVKAAGSGRPGSRAAGG